MTTRIFFILTLLAFFNLPLIHAASPAVSAPALDTDEDGLIDSWETILGTDVNNHDSDGDGYKDGEEVAAGYGPQDSAPIKKEKLIKVSLKEQKLRYFFDGKQLEEFAISSGLPKSPTPKGEFSVLRKRPVVWYKGVLAGKKYNYPNTKWNLEFKRGKGYSYYIHGAYWHNQFGRQRSAGCVNVPYSHMERLYNFAEEGTRIIIE